MREAGDEANRVMWNLGFLATWIRLPLDNWAALCSLSFSIILKNVRHGNFKINEYKLNQNK